MMAAGPAPEHDPIEEEGRRLLDEDRELLEELRDFDQRYAAGEVDLVPHQEVRRRLKLDPDESQ